MHSNNSSDFVIIPSDYHDNGFIDLVQISSSSFVNVYKARRGERLFVLKALSEPYINNQTYINILKKEYEIGCRFDHPGICRIISFENLPKLGPAILMEYVNGISLRQQLKSGNIPYWQVCSIIHDMLTAVAYIHKCGYIHNDLKPENILLSNNSENLKIIDFGLSHGVVYRNPIVDGGTVAYNNQQSNGGGYTSNDIYALGKIIRELVEASDKKPNGLYLKLSDIACNKVDGKCFTSASEMLTFISNEIDTNKKKRAIIYGAATLVFFIGVVMFLLFNTAKYTPIQPNIQDINKAHYQCYHKIDSLLTVEQEVLIRTINKEETIIDLTKDSVRIAKKLSKTIDSEYGINKESVERNNSVKWAYQELKSMLESLRTQY